MAIKNYPVGSIPSVSGQSGKYLTNDGASLSWTAISSGSGGASPGITLLSTTTLSGASVTFTGISQLYKDLVLIIRNSLINTTNQAYIRFNSDSGNNYQAFNRRMDSNGTISDYNWGGNATSIGWGGSGTTSGGFISLSMLDYTNTNTNKYVRIEYNDPATAMAGFGYGMWRPSTKAAITSISLNAGGTWTQGTALLYGVA
jgi:hypothetical protein